MRQYTSALPGGQNKKAELAKGISFGSSAIFSKDPPLSYPSGEGIGFVGKHFSSVFSNLIPLNLFSVKVYF